MSSVEAQDQGMMSEFERDLSRLLNRYNQENESDTPDYILARYLTGCLRLFNATVIQRSGWYGHHDSPGSLRIPVSNLSSEVGEQ